MDICNWENVVNRCRHKGATKGVKESDEDHEHASIYLTCCQAGNRERLSLVIVRIHGEA